MRNHEKKLLFLYVCLEIIYFMVMKRTLLLETYVTGYFNQLEKITDDFCL